MARAKRSETEVSVAFRLSRGLHEQLKQAGGERGLSEEIRHRLEASFASAPDAETSQFLTQIAHAAKLLGQYGGPHHLHLEGIDPPQREPRPSTSWHANPRAFAIFAAAVNILLGRQKPTGKPSGDRNVMFEGAPEEAGQRLAILVDIDLA